MDSPGNDLPPSLQQDAAGGLGCIRILSTVRDANGRGDGYFSLNQRIAPWVPSRAPYPPHVAPGTNGIGGYIPPAIYDPGLFPIDEFPYSNGHGNDSQLGVNANGFHFTQPQFITNGGFTPAISSISATSSGQGLLNGGEFGNINGYLDNSLPATNAHGLNYDHNVLPTYGSSYGNNLLPTYVSSYGNNPPPTMYPNSYNHGHNPLPTVDDLHGSSFITQPQLLPNFAMTPTSPGLVGATPLIPLMNPAPVGPPATPPSARHACPDCKRTFGRPSDLKRHAAKHISGPRPYSCPSKRCSYKGSAGFTRKDKMKDHVRNMHPEIDDRYL